MHRTTIRIGILAALLASLFRCLPAEADVAPGVDRAAVAQAIERGVIYLKRDQGKDGRWSYIVEGRPDGGEPEAPLTQYTSIDAGVTALVGLALLEAGVAPDDPALQKAADYLRQGVPDGARDSRWTRTHSLGAAVMFFDRLNDARDGGRIKTLAARLVAGQNLDGGWGYSCPWLTEDEVAKLNYASESQYREGLAKLRKQAVAQRAPGTPNGPGGFGAFDGQSTTEQSCSEFAIQALWVARRHKVPVTSAMIDYEKMCRAHQSKEGYFPYSTRKGGFGERNATTNPCMTGAGLLGLLTCHGSANEAALLKYAKSKSGAQPVPGKGLRDLAKDPATVKGVAALEMMMVADGKAKDVFEKSAAGSSNIVGAPHWEANSKFVYMALWSVERVAVAYDLERIGKIDWYEWGARKLLKWQDKDGSWGAGADPRSPHLNTAFALLFLRRAQPVPDLYLALKGVLPPPRETSSSSSPSIEK